MNASTIATKLLMFTLQRSDPSARDRTIEELLTSLREVEPEHLRFLVPQVASVVSGSTTAQYVAGTYLRVQGYPKLRSDVIARYEQYSATLSEDGCRDLYRQRCAFLGVVVGSDSTMWYCLNSPLPGMLRVVFYTSSQNIAYQLLPDGAAHKVADRPAQRSIPPAESAHQWAARMDEAVKRRDYTALDRLVSLSSAELLLVGETVDFLLSGCRSIVCWLPHGPYWRTPVNQLKVYAGLPLVFGKPITLAGLLQAKALFCLRRPKARPGRVYCSVAEDLQEIFRACLEPAIRARAASPDEADIVLVLQHGRINQGTYTSSKGIGLDELVRSGVTHSADLVIAATCSGGHPGDSTHVLGDPLGFDLAWALLGGRTVLSSPWVMPTAYMMFVSSLAIRLYDAGLSPFEAGTVSRLISASNDDWSVLSRRVVQVCSSLQAEGGGRLKDVGTLVQAPELEMAWRWWQERLGLEKLAEHISWPALRVLAGPEIPSTAETSLILDALSRSSL